MAIGERRGWFGFAVFLCALAKGVKGDFSGRYASPDRHFVTTSFPPRVKKPRNYERKFYIESQVSKCSRPFPDCAMEFVHDGVVSYPSCTNSIVKK